MGKYGVLGSGTVGRALASKLISLGHEVTLGSRTPDNAAGQSWAAEAGQGASAGTFAQAAGFGEVVILAVQGQHALSVIEAAGEGLDGKVLADVTNPLDFSKGFPPRLSVCNDDSLGEQIQRAAPKARVVKTFNTLGSSLMVDPSRLPEATDVFVAGDDPEAKAAVAGMLGELGHKAPVDMGGIEASRALEAWLLMWTRLYGVLGTADFNIKIVRKEG